MTLEALRIVLKERPNKLIYGTKQALKQIKHDHIKEVFLANDCTEETREKIKNYTNFSELKVYELQQSSEELALLCKKDFAVSVISVLNGIGKEIKERKVAGVTKKKEKEKSGKVEEEIVEKIEKPEKVRKGRAKKTKAEGEKEETEAKAEAEEES